MAEKVRHEGVKKPPLLKAVFNEPALATALPD